MDVGGEEAENGFVSFSPFFPDFQSLHIFFYSRSNGYVNFIKFFSTP